MEGTIVALVMERGKATIWSLNWDVKLLAALYSVRTQMILSHMNFTCHCHRDLIYVIPRQLCRSYTIKVLNNQKRQRHYLSNPNLVIDLFFVSQFHNSRAIKKATKHLCEESPQTMGKITCFKRIDKPSVIILSHSTGF